MDPRPKTTPKDFFFYFGAMITLYWSAISLLTLLFQIVDTVFRDDLNSYVDPYSGGIRFAIASLIVLFPVSVLLFRTIKMGALREPIKFSLPLRRWLYALTIFVTAIALIGDVIALLNSFLGGELTARFVFKVISVLVVAGVVFWYCLLEIRIHPDTPAKPQNGFLFGTPLLVLGAIVYGFIVMGSPSAQRSLRFDDQRLSELQSIQWQVVNFWQQKGRMPVTLTEMEDSISGWRVSVDPATKAPYEFIPGEKNTFKLCAVFERQSTSFSPSSTKPYPSVIAGENWQHGVGRTCFDRTIDPEFYPPVKRPI
ncbi:MAG: DUF5671 domain-containing protein [bacterium]|nr:DUF5671 domain-containing protein [bacterium]